jgi:hypothetical protein
MPAPNSTPASGSFPSLAAEAARYALLRRLAPSMRHHLVVNLQPIGMIYEVMERRLRAPAPDFAHVQDSASKINGFAKAALQSSIDVVGWLAQDDAATTPLAEAVRECTLLLATSLSFRGYALRNETAALPGVVRRCAIRNLLTGALVHATDHWAGPADLVLATQAADDAAVVTITLRPTQADKGFTAEANYRKIEWSDLEAIAAADGAGLAQDGPSIQLRFPWCTPAA